MELKTRLTSLLAAGLAAGAVALTPVTAEAVVGTPVTYRCSGPVANVTNSDSRFVQSRVWVFGDSILSRCTWEFENQGFLANGDRGAFWADSGAYSRDGLAFLSGLKQRVGSYQPRVIIWQLGTNDTKEYMGEVHVTNDLRAVKNLFPNSLIIWVNTYRGGAQQVVCNYLNNYVTANTGGVAVTSNWSDYAGSHAGIVFSPTDQVHPTYNYTAPAANGGQQYTNRLLTYMYR